MQLIIFSVYYIILLLAAITGIIRYRHLDTALRFIVILLMLTVTSETASYILVELKEYGMRYSFFHIYSILQLLLISLFFIYAIKPYHYRKLIVVASALSPLMGILNIIYLQPIDKLNTNMLMFESFAINAMSLFYIYWAVKNTSIKRLFKHAHFQMSLLFIFIWSCTFFFWAFISVLYIGEWKYVNYASYVIMMVNIIVYGGIGLTIYHYPIKYNGND